MKIDIALRVGKKGLRTKFEDEDDNDILIAYITALVKSLRVVQGERYTNMKLLAHRCEGDLK